MINVIYGFIGIVFPILVGGAFFKQQPISTSSWILGIIFSAYLVMMCNGLGLHPFLMYTCFFVLSIIGLHSIWLSNNYYFIWRRKIKLSDKLSYLNIYILFLLTLLAVFILNSILEIIRFPLTAGDALAYWLFKAKAFTQWVPLSDFPTVSYPSLGSAIWAYSLIFVNEEYYGRIIFLLLFCAFFINFVLTCIRKFELTLSHRLLIYTIITLFLIIGLTEKFGGEYSFIHAGYVDWLVSLLVSYGYFSIIIQIVTKQTKKLFHRSLILPCFYMGCGGLVKEEGIFYSLICLISILIVGALKNKNEFYQSIRQYLFIVLFTVLISFGYKFLIIFNNLSLSNAQGFSLSVIFSNITRIFDAEYVFQIIISLTTNLIYRYEIFLPTVCVILLSLLNRSGKLAVSLVLPIALSISFFFLIFLVTNAPLEWHLVTSLERLLFFPLLMCVFGNVLILFYVFSNKTT